MRLPKPEAAVFLAGVGLVAAALTGGGITAAGVEVPVIEELSAQITLGVLGGVVVLVSFLPSGATRRKEQERQAEPSVPGSPNRSTVRQAVVHYHRPDGDYDGWRLYFWGGGLPRGAQPVGFDASVEPQHRDRDDFGVAWRIDVADPSKPIEFVVNQSEHVKDPWPDQLFIPARMPHAYVASGRVPVFATADEALAAAARLPEHEVSYATIHYRQPGGRYEGWGLYVWGGGLAPGVHRPWHEPIPPHSGDRDDFGVFWRIPLVNRAKEVSFSIHRQGQEREVEQAFYPARQPAAYVVSGQHRPTPYASADAAIGH